MTRGLMVRPRGFGPLTYSSGGLQRLGHTETTTRRAPMNSSYTLTTAGTCKATSGTTTRRNILGSGKSAASISNTAVTLSRAAEQQERSFERISATREACIVAPNSYEHELGDEVVALRSRVGDRSREAREPCSIPARTVQ